MSAFLSLFSVSETAAARPAADPVRAQQATARFAGVSAPGAGDADRPIEQAFSAASEATGLPFDYFMTTAMRESSLDVNAAATTSSARGPFQFIEQTWLGMVHEHGAGLGLDAEASTIERRSDGRYVVSDPGMREALLGLRHDPELSAVMSGLYLQDNAAELTNALGRDVTVGEGYVAHVFGASGASRLITLAEQQPNRAAADVFPTQAAANRGLFYDRSGDPVSVRQLYDRLVDGFPQTPIPQTPPQFAASETSRRDPSAPLSLEPAGFDALPAVDPVEPDAMHRLGLFTAANARDAVSQPAIGVANQPFFAALYRPDGFSAGTVQDAAIGTHGSAQATAVADPRPLPSIPSDAVPNPTTNPLAPGAPLDLVRFVQAGDLASLYQSPTRTGPGMELVPPA